MNLLRRLLILIDDRLEVSIDRHLDLADIPHPRRSVSPDDVVVPFPLHRASGGAA